jgi:hypothetical protein
MASSVSRAMQDTAQPITRGTEGAPASSRVCGRWVAGRGRWQGTQSPCLVQMGTPMYRWEGTRYYSHKCTDQTWPHVDA